MAELCPRTTGEAADALRVLGALSPEERAVTSVSVEAFTSIAEPDLRSATLKAGAGARMTAVQAALGRWALTLGSLTPGALTLTVGEWLEGRHAGLRVVPGNRLESAALSIEIALEGGGTFTTHPSPRSAAGPGLDAPFLGGGRRAGVIVAATLRALPRFDSREWVHATLPSAEIVVSVLRTLLQRDVPLSDVVVERRARVFEVDLLLIGPNFRLKRDRAVTEAMVGAQGHKRTMRAVSERSLAFEGELSWDALPALLAAGDAVTLTRLCRESLVVLGGHDISSAISLSSAPTALPQSFYDALTNRTVRETP